MSAISRNNGFTLLEILIAVVLLGILAGALYGSYFGVVQARERSAAGMESRREMGATLDLIRREVSSAMHNDKDTRLRFVVEDRDNFGVPSSTLELTTLAPPDPSRKESGIVVVQYRMAEKDKKRILTRQERDLVFDGPAAVPAFPQMEHISAFQVECYDESRSKWIKTWTSLNTGLPKQVRVTVQIEEEGRPVEFSVYAAPRISGS